jgi:hypothetical protein
MTAVYKGATPFVYARDGHPEGIKQESAQIADEIRAGAWGAETPRILSYDDFAAMYRAVHESTAVIYACGFEKGAVTVSVDGESRVFHHDGTRFVDAPPGLYGFGLGFPSFYSAADGKMYTDVGFGPFVAAIKSAGLPLDAADPALPPGVRP